MWLCKGIEILAFLLLGRNFDVHLRGGQDSKKYIGGAAGNETSARCLCIH
jgi:hypothetical protein